MTPRPPYRPPARPEDRPPRWLTDLVELLVRAILRIFLAEGSDTLVEPADFRHAELAPHLSSWPAG
jgi:hypothetical protein